MGFKLVASAVAGPDSAPNCCAARTMEQSWLDVHHCILGRLVPLTVWCRATDQIRCYLPRGNQIGAGDCA